MAERYVIFSSRKVKGWSRKVKGWIFSQNFGFYKFWIFSQNLKTENMPPFAASSRATAYIVMFGEYALIEGNKCIGL